MNEESAFLDSNSVLRFMTFALVFFAVHVVVELNTYWWRRVRIWKRYHSMFPSVEFRAPLDALPPSFGVLGDLELRHAWRYLHGGPDGGIETSRTWFTLIPSTSDWLAVTLDEEGISFRNATSVFPQVNNLSDIRVPWIRILWANLRRGPTSSSSLLELKLESIRTPEHDQLKVAPPQITAWIPISRGRQEIWCKKFSAAGVKLLRMDS